MEQWKSGQSATTLETLPFEYSLDATSLFTGTWTAATGMDLVEKLTSTTVSAAVDGNLPANRTAISATITGLSIANNAVFWIRWTDTNDLGSDGMYAIDDFSLTPSTTLLISATSLTGFTTTQGTPSLAQSYTLSAAFPTASGATVTAPANFEVSQTSATSGFAASLAITQADLIAGKTIYVRLTGAAAGTFAGNVANSATGATTKNVAVDGTVNSAGAAALTVSPAALGPFLTSVGTPSAAQSYTLTGSNLATDATVVAPSGYEVSQTSATAGFSASLTVLKAAATAGQTIYVRLTGATLGTYGTAGTPVNVTNDSSPAITQNVALNGTVAQPITVTPTSLPAFAPNQVGTPSAPQSYALQALNLTNPLIVTAPTGFEVSSDGITYAATLNLGSANGNYTIRVRLSGAARGSYSGNVTNESTGANTPNNVAVSGNTFAAPATYFLVTGATDLTAPANYNTVADGSGTPLSGFDVENATLVLAGPPTLLLNGNVTLTGSGSKFVLGNGTAAISLTLPATGAELSAVLDVKANATLLVLDLTPSNTLGTLDVASTIDFAQAGTYVVPSLGSPGYGNLTLTNGIKQFVGSATAATNVYIRGNLTADAVSNLNGASVTPFSTVDLKGNFTLLNGSAFDTDATGRFTLLLSAASGTQTLTGNGADFKLFRLTTTGAATNAALATAGGSSHLLLGNANSGGYTLGNGTTLALNGNNLTFINSNTSIGSGSGNLTSVAGSTITLNHNGTTSVGSLRLAAGEIPALLVINAAGTAKLVSLGLNTTLANVTITSGTLGLSGNTLTLTGVTNVDAVNGTLQGSATSKLTLGAGSSVVGQLNFTTAAGSSLSALTLSQSTNLQTQVNSTLTVATLALNTGSLFFLGTNKAIVTTSFTGGSATSFVNALSLKTAAATAPAAIMYPLGAQDYLPLSFAPTQTAATATAYTARITVDNANSRGVTAPITRVSARHYFTLAEDGTTNYANAGTLTLSFANEGANDPTTLRIASSTAAGPWTDVNPGSTPAVTGTPAGTITDNVTALVDFALATTSTGLIFNPLPVELTAFSAQRQADKSVGVKWATASEKNSASFDVQRSLDGREYFTVATAAAQGSSSHATAYAALDQTAPSGTLYYRLRQVDRDGATSFSPIAIVASNNEAIRVLLYPNPASAALHFVATTGQAYRVLNQLGQPLLRGTTEAGTTTIAVENLPSGLYFLQLQTATGRVVQKFEKE